MLKYSDFMEIGHDPVCPQRCFREYFKVEKIILYSLTCFFTRMENYWFSIIKSWCITKTFHWLSKIFVSTELKIWNIIKLVFVKIFQNIFDGLRIHFDNLKLMQTWKVFIANITKRFLILILLQSWYYRCLYKLLTPNISQFSRDKL